MTQSWQCPKCKREFVKKNQAHSCAVYPLAKHFVNKPYAKELFEHLKKKIVASIGPVKVESLPCCIHFVSSYTFGAVWAMKNGLRIDFRVDHPIRSRRYFKKLQISANRYMYYIDIKDKEEIDRELIDWIGEAYNLRGG